MTTASTLIRYLAFGLIALFGFVGAAFIVGETAADPGGWQAAVLITLWLVPLVGLSVFALRRPDPAIRLLAACLAVAATVAVVDAATQLIPSDEWGPVVTIAMFAVGIPIGFLGLHRPRPAGLMLVIAGVVQGVALAIDIAVREGGPDVSWSMASTSAGAIALPLVVVGLLMLAAGLLDRKAGGRPLMPSA